MKREKWEINTLFACIIALILILLLFTGCASKQIQLKEYVKQSEVIEEKTVNLTTKSIDTTKVSNIETNMETIEFFNPSEISDYDKILLLMQERNEPYSAFGLVKSITKIADKVVETQQGVIEEQSTTFVEVSKESDVEIKREEKVKQLSFWDRYKVYIVITVLIAIIAMVWRVFSIKDRV